MISQRREEAVALPVQKEESVPNVTLRPPWAFLFPGQGAQEVGMGLSLYEGSPAARRVFEEADSALGTPLSEIMFRGPAKELERTDNSQPAIFAASLACLAAVKEQAGPHVLSQIRFMAGHSLGEYTALVAAEVLDLGDAVKLVRERGRLMQDACEQNPGAMAAVLGLEESALAEVCREAGVQMANINAPGQIVISGETPAIAKAVDLAMAKGAKRCIPLKVSGAFHSYLMRPAMEGMLKALDSVKFRNPVTPIVANCTGKPLASSREVKEELAQQLCGCVRWHDSVNFMVEAGVTSFVEFGPGRVLSGMVKRIAGNVSVASVNDPASVQSLVASQTRQA